MATESPVPAERDPGGGYPGCATCGGTGVVRYPVRTRGASIMVRGGCPECAERALDAYRAERAAKDRAAAAQEAAALRRALHALACDCWRDGAAEHVETLRRLLADAERRAAPAP